VSRDIPDVEPPATGGSDGSKGTRIRDVEEGYDVDTEASVFEGGQDGKVHISNS